MTTYSAADGAQLAYADAGEGAPPIVLVHGWQADGTGWREVGDRLAVSYRVITVDLRGFGESRAAAGPYVVKQFSADIATLVEALDLGRILLVGHSMGGAIAQRFAVDHRDMLAGIVLVAPVPSTGLRLPPHVEALFRSTAGNAETTAKWLKMLTRNPLPPELFSSLQDAAAKVPAHVAIEAFESWTRLHFSGEAQTIVTPTLVIAPDSDRPMTPDYLHEKVVQVIPGAGMTIVEEAGHYVQIEKAERTAALIDEFAGKLVPRDH